MRATFSLKACFSFSNAARSAANLRIASLISSTVGAGGLTTSPPFAFEAGFELGLGLALGLGFEAEVELSRSGASGARAARGDDVANRPELYITPR